MDLIGHVQARDLYRVTDTFDGRVRQTRRKFNHENVGESCNRTNSVGRRHRCRSWQYPQMRALGSALASVFLPMPAITARRPATPTMATHTVVIPAICPGFVGGYWGGGWGHGGSGGRGGFAGHGSGGGHGFGGHGGGRREVIDAWNARLALMTGSLGIWGSTRVGRGNPRTDSWPLVFQMAYG